MSKDTKNATVSTFVATPRNPDLSPVTVRVTHAEPQLTIQQHAKIEIEGYEGVRARLSHRYEKGVKIPALALYADGVEAIWGFRPQVKESWSTVDVPLDRDWEDEVKAQALAERDARFAEARAKIEADPSRQVHVAKSYGTGVYYHAWGGENLRNHPELRLEEDVRDYLNHLLQPDAARNEGAGKRLEFRARMEGGSYCNTTAGEILRIADEMRAEREQKEAEKREREAAVQEASQGCVILHFHAELMPHTQDLTGEILNRPAPQGGAFLLRERLEKDEWTRLKEAGAWFWSKDDLEEFDMFWSDAGWRYSLAAVEAAIELGYAVQIGDELPVTSTEQLRDLFTDQD